MLSITHTNALVFCVLKSVRIHVKRMLGAFILHTKTIITECKRCAAKADRQRYKRTDNYAGKRTIMLP